MHFVLIAGPGEPVAPNALVLSLCRIWKEQGHRISSAQSRVVSGDCALLHVDTTKIDPRFLSQFDPAMPILNRRALDISKRFVSRNLVSLDDDYSGPVIVKTDANAYGIPQYPHTADHEQRLNARMSVTLHNWHEKRMLPIADYPILGSKYEVPDWVWSNPDIIVEKFMPEKEDGLYVLRLWVFFGPRDFALKVYGRNPVVKSGDRVRYEYIPEVPPELHRERQRLGFDYGKFDYVMHEGKAVLIDANKTPSVSNASQTPEYAYNLAAGLSEMFPDRA